LLALAPAALAWWSADESRYLAASESALVMIDVRGGRVERAFPRHVTVGGRVAVQAGALMPLRFTELDGNPVLLSRDGKRMVATSGAVHVWSVDDSRLLLRIPGARAAALLGPQGDEIALIRRRDGAAWEFGIWDVAAEKALYSRVMVAPEAMFPVLTRSERFAAFAVGGRELWVWSHERRSLERVELPDDFAIHGPLEFSRDGAWMAVSGGAARPPPLGAPAASQVAVYSTRDWRLVQRHPVAGGNPPVALGWTRGGEFLVARESLGRDLMQFDARSGALLHRWRYVTPLAFTTESSPGSSRRRARLRGGTAGLADRAVLSPAGDRLAFLDETWSAVVAWDVTVSPPRRAADLCPPEACGDEPAALEFSPSGRTLLVFSRADPRSLWRVDTQSGQRERIDIEPAAAQRAAGAVSLAGKEAVGCGWSRAGCVDQADPARACAAWSRDACLAAGRSSLQAGRAAQALAFYEQACYIDEDAACLAGLRAASKLPGAPRRASTAAKPQAAVEAPALCKEWPYLRMRAVRVYQDDEFVGIRVRSIVGDAPGRWPFAPGDVLLNSIRCKADGCAPDDFKRTLGQLCSGPLELLHDLRLEVRSAEPARNRDFILRRAGAAPTS
jgi:hypothetical protein